MNVIERQSNEWIQSFCEWYNAKQNILFEAFIEFYGEEEREKLIKEIDDIPFLFLLSDVAYLSCKNIPNDYFAKRLELYFRHNRLFLNSLARKGVNKRKILHERVKQSMLTKYPQESFEYYLHENFILELSNATTHFDIDGTNPIIILPIYFITDQIIIHEIDHVLTTPKREGNLFPSEEVDELINELIAQDVLKIFRNLGGRILPYELDIKLEYEDNLFLMKDFYERFKDLIKKCVRNDNLKILEDNLGKENLRVYFALVKKLYYKNHITDKDLKRIRFLINQMDIYHQTKKTQYDRTRLRVVEQ